MDRAVFSKDRTVFFSYVNGLFENEVKLMDRSDFYLIEVSFTGQK